MSFQSLEIINLLLSVALLVVVWRREADAILLCLFVYGSLFYSYTLLPLFAGWKVSQLSDLHLQGSGMLAKIYAVLFLVAIFSVLGFRSLKLRDLDKHFVYLCLVSISALFIGYFLEMRLGDWQQLQNVVSLALMLFLMLLGFNGLKGGHFYSFTKQWPWTVLKGLVMTALLIGFYEVFSLRAWANFADASGALIYRASSFLYNPNLYGIWGAMITMGFAYAMHKGIGRRHLASFGVVVSSAGVLLSGSRSAIFLLLISLVIVVALIGSMNIWRRCQPLLLVLLTFLVIGSGALTLEKVGAENQEGWRAIRLLSERAWSAPLMLGKYLLLSAKSVPPEVAVAIEGRFSGGMKDSGWLVLYDDTGWPGAASFMLMGVVFCVCGIRTYLARRDVSSSYALALLFFCAAVGLVMRYQVFPVWLFIGVVMAPCLVVWRGADGACRERQDKLPPGQVS